MGGPDRSWRKNCKIDVDTILDQQKEMAETLADYGDLFKIEDDEMSLESLQDRLTLLDAMGVPLSQLKERGVLRA